MLVKTMLYLFCGIGGGAKGFQKARAEYKGMAGRFETIVGIDCDPEACQDFEAITGAPAICMDLFTWEDYIIFHGSEPPAGWREITAHDIWQACGGVCPDGVFLSPPCKGFSGLLPSEKANSEKYQALNRLVVRGLTLILEAFPDDKPAFIILENVPRITSRGAKLLKQIKKLLGNYGYLFHEDTHDCGELGGLGQHRVRYLLLARDPEKITSFIYRPHKKRVKSIGEVIGLLPLPDDPTMGPMHRLPRLQWKTWVRLALIPAGGDWRDLNNAGNYGIEYIPRDGGWQVAPWEETSGTIVGSARVGHSNGVSAIADPRLNISDGHQVLYRVTKWEDPSGAITGAHGPNNGAITIADPRVTKQGFSNCYQLHDWEGPAGTVTGIADIQSGAQSIADPRPTNWRNGWKLSGAEGRVNLWDQPTDVVLGHSGVRSNGAANVADPRLGCNPRNGTMGVQAWDKPSGTIIGAGDIHAGAAAVADPRIPADNERPDPPPVIIALDGTWHRPLTTLELAVLQSLNPIMPDGRPLQLAGNSDARWRERIGNMVPPDAAEAIAEEILLSFLASEFNDDFRLTTNGIWVAPSRRNREEGRISYAN